MALFARIGGSQRAYRVHSHRVIIRYNECQEYIDDLTAFGWQKTEVRTERKTGRGSYTRNYQILARDTAMPNYLDLKKYENDYEFAKRGLKSYASIDGLTLFLLLLLFIFPGLLYYLYKSNQKTNIENNNNECRLKMKQAVNAAKNIK